LANRVFISYIKNLNYYHLSRI